ncbi:MAG: VWA domain-containing protein [Candidatus Acidiferrum sp.]
MTTDFARRIVLFMVRILTALALLFLGLAAIATSAQLAPQQQPITVSTRLVQVGVIVRDKNGPVADLTKDDFVVLDRGKPQKISVFTVESSEPAAQPSLPLPQNTFSDLPQYGAATARSVTIVLLDNLNTLYGSAPGNYESTPYWMEDLALANAKNHLIEFIRELSPQDQVAVYGLRDSLQVLCDFTSDRAQLLTILKKYDTTSKTNREMVEPGAVHTPMGPDVDALMNAEAVRLAGLANQERAEKTMAALVSIAGHVANIPGRKNLVWLTANLPFSSAAMARVLSPARIAAYPIDARGLLAREPSQSKQDGIDFNKVLGDGESMPAQSLQPIGNDTMQKLADETGGEAFINTNDITGAIRRAVEDSAVTYRLGFYIDRDSIDGKLHELKVEPKRKGLTIRYPKSYFAFEDAPPTKDQNWKTVVTAVQSPIESSVIPLQAKVDRVEQPLPNSLRLLCSIDIHNLRFVQTGDLRKGALSVYVIEQDGTGKVLRQWSKIFDLQLSEKQYAALLKSGMPFSQDVQPKAGVTTLRVLVEDPATAEVGSLIIPLSQVK